MTGNDRINLWEEIVERSLFNGHDRRGSTQVSDFTGNLSRYKYIHELVLPPTTRDPCTVRPMLDRYWAAIPIELLSHLVRLAEGDYGITGESGHRATSSHTVQTRIRMRIYKSTISSTFQNVW